MHLGRGGKLHPAVVGIDRLHDRLPSRKVPGVSVRPDDIADIMVGQKALRLGIRPAIEALDLRDERGKLRQIPFPDQEGVGKPDEVGFCAKLP